MTENLNSHRHAMRILRDLERQIDGGSPAANSRPAPSTQGAPRTPVPTNYGPQSNMRRDRPEEWTIPNIAGFTNDGQFDPYLLADNWGGMAREAQRQIGGALEPVANAVGGGVRAAQQWNRERQLSPQQAAELRRVNASAGALSADARDLGRRENERVATYERGNRYIGQRLDSAMYDPQRSPFSGSAPPQSLSDEDLRREMAELDAQLGRGGPQ